MARRITISSCQTSGGSSSPADRNARADLVGVPVRTLNAGPHQGFRLPSRADLAERGQRPGRQDRGHGRARQPRHWVTCPSGLALAAAAAAPASRPKQVGYAADVANREWGCHRLITLVRSRCLSVYPLTQPPPCRSR